MSTATLPLPLEPGAIPTRRTFNPWVIAIIVVVPTFMEILDTTIANVALRYISGGLSAAQSDAEWVITVYLAANAVVLPITGWLSANLGRRNYFLLSITVFTIASALCGMATSLTQIIIFRILQGFAGGGLQPSSQGILLDEFPPEKQGTAQTLFGVAAVLGPIVGPTLGGWFCVNYNWRYIFLVNVPIGLLALFAAYAVVQDPPYLVKERAELRRKPLNFDYIGLSLLMLVMASWEVILSKGQEWDWMKDPFWRVQTLIVAFVLGVLFLIFWEKRAASPIINFKVLRERNLTICCIIMFFSFAVVYAANILLPGLLQNLFGYDALRSGEMVSPSGISSMAAMVLCGILLGRQFDARYMIGSGLVVLCASNLFRAHQNLQIGPWHVIWPHMLVMLGIGLIFAPLSVAAYKYTPLAMRGAAVGIVNLLRNEGGSFGTSVSQICQERRMQFHVSRVGEFLDPLNPHVTNFLGQARAGFMQYTGDPAASKQMALQTLENLRQQQAGSMAFFDVFWLCAMLAAALLILVPFMKRSVAEKGEIIRGE